MNNSASATTAKAKLASGPPATIAARWLSRLQSKDSSRSSADSLVRLFGRPELGSASPDILTNPPSGIALNGQGVPDRSHQPYNSGPKPIENTSIFTPL